MVYPFLPNSINLKKKKKKKKVDFPSECKLI